MPTVPSVSVSTFQVQEAGQRALDLVGAPGKVGLLGERMAQVTGSCF